MMTMETCITKMSYIFRYYRPDPLWYPFW